MLNSNSCLTCGETEAHSSNTTTAQQVSGRELAHSKLPALSLQTWSSCSCSFQSDPRIPPKELAQSCLWTRPALSLQGAFPLRLLQAAFPGSSSLPSACHALLTGDLLLGPFFPFVFCLHIRDPSGPGLPHLVFCPSCPPISDGAKKMSW